MQIDLDDIKWGNPSRQDAHNMLVNNYLDEVLPSLLSYCPHKNSSVATREELNQLVTYSKYEESSARRNIFDADLVPYIRELFICQGADYNDIISTTNSLVEDVLPVITKLKYEFQRPRPFQLAIYYDLALFPGFSKYVSSPSYPSGHSVMTAVMTEVLATHYSVVFPTCYDVMRKFAGEVMESRKYLGVHYESDNRFALQVADAIINDKNFRLKYEF